jgi:hypothetical protein
LAQIRSTIKLEMEHSSNSWKDLFATPGMRRRALIAGFLGLFTQMSGNTLLSYYQNLLFDLMGFTETYPKTRINIANQCWSLITATIIALIVSRFPRRKMFMLSAGSMVMMFMGMTICFERLSHADANGYTNKSAQYAALFFFFAYSPTYNIGNNSLTYTYLVELFPYQVRSMGIGFEQIWGKIGGFFSINVNPKAITAIGWKYFAIYCGWITFEFMFIYFMYPETHGRTLEELAFCKSLQPPQKWIKKLIRTSVRRQGARRPGRQGCREGGQREPRARRREGSRHDHRAISLDCPLEYVLCRARIFSALLEGPSRLCWQTPINDTPTPAIPCPVP